MRRKLLIRLQKVDSWEDLVSKLKHGKKILTGSRAAIRTTKNAGYYLEIELQDSKKDQEEELINNDKLVNELLDSSLAYLFCLTKSTNFKGIYFVENIDTENKMYKDLEELGFVLEFMERKC